LLIAATAAAAGAAFALSGSVSAGSAAAYPVVHPAAQDSVQVATGVLPPTQAACNAVGRRCFTPASMQNSYDITPLLGGGNDGHGKTIAIIDSFGYDTVAGDLENFSKQFGLPLMCGMPGVTCAPGMPTFEWDQWDGKRPVKQAPTGSHGTGQQDSNAWAEEVALDTQWAHATAPGANIILMTTSVAETQGVQGLPQMMNAEQYLVDNHLADVVSQSFSTAEPNLNGNAIQNLRHAFISGTASGVTFLSSSGDNGTENNAKTPIKNPAALDFPSVGWPASDPLVTAVGGTYLCTDGATGTTVDSTSPGGLCRKFPGQRDVGWTFSGGGYSSLFARPSYQDTLPAGSTPIGAMRGVPDIAYQASAGTGVLIYDTAPGDNGGSDVNDGSWYVIGGTSSSSPQWAGLVAIADQMAGHDLGLIQPKLYSLASGADYGKYFFDVTTGNNTVSSTVPGYPATTGWDPVTGLGTPDAAKLVPALGK
jgi:subtilase family serine protease